MIACVRGGNRASGAAASAFAAALFALCIPAHAERLPIRTYSMADGLPRNQVNDIMQDSRGFIWLCTSEGVSRFDGYGFRNYGESDGLPNQDAYEMVETRYGDSFVVVSGLLYAFDPHAARGTHPERPFAPFAIPTVSPQQRVTALCTTRSGVVWCGAGEDLFRLVHHAERWHAEKVAWQASGSNRITTLLEDLSGTLWIGTEAGLFRMRSDGSCAVWDPDGAVNGRFVISLAVDAWGLIWVGMQELTARIPPAVAWAGAQRRAETFVYGRALPGHACDAILATRDAVWVGTVGGLTRFSLDAGGSVRAIRSYTRANGLSQTDSQPLAEDRDGNIWVGSENGGAMKITPRGLVTYDAQDGLKQDRAAEIFEDRSGTLIVFTNYWGDLYFHRWDGERFVAVKPSVPGADLNTGWGTHQVALQDSQGEWWMGTGEGLYRYPRSERVDDLARTPPRNIYRFAAAGALVDDVFRVYEDRRGDIWINAMSSRSRDYTMRWSRKGSTLRPIALGFPAVHPSAFEEDRAGCLWIGFYAFPRLARVVGERIDLFTEADGIPSSFAFDIHFDRAGELWLATSAGVLHCKNPAADHPRFEKPSMTGGLASRDVRCIAEDQYGRLYFGSARGVIRYDPRTASLRHYTTTDGLANPEVLLAFRDRHGDIWFGTGQGLSRLTPSEDLPSRPPAVYITSARFGGAPRGISELGDAAVGPVTLQPGQNRVQIEFVGLGFAPGESMHYQYKLDGVDSDWGEVTERRAVDFAGLGAGTYRFLVRSVSSSGLSSDRPASARFTILRPVWQRWWFLGGMALALGSAVLAVHRLRLRHLLALERVRTRIATDLHDDIGSSLTQISIMSEVACRQLAGRSEAASEIVSKVAETSRDLVDSMSDIVWAINPRRDSLQDLVNRMHRLASDVLTARDVVFDFSTTGRLDATPLGPDLRRDVFLIYKEALNNIARHSACTEVLISIDVDGPWLDIRLRDNGRGFDPSAAGSDGNGLASMRGRAAGRGGTIRFDSALGQGADVHARIPMRQGFKA